MKPRQLIFEWINVYDENIGWARLKVPFQRLDDVIFSGFVDFGAYV